MAAFTININEGALNSIAEEIGNKTVEQLKVLGDDQSLLLKKIALDYLTSVKNNMDKIKLIEENQKKLKEKRRVLNFSKNPKDQKIVKEYTQFKEELKKKVNIDLSLNDFFKQSLIFNDSIVEVITGKKSKITVVIPIANETPIIQDYTIQELLDEKSGITIVQDIASGKIPRVTGRLKYDIDQMKKNFNNAFRKDNIIDAEELKSLNETYNSALFDNFNKYKPYVFWKPLKADHWFKMKISGGAGDISEGYAYFYYKGADTNFSFAIHHLYDNLDTFFRIGVASVSNLSGLYAGDISMPEYQYAVKSLQAALPGYVQMMKMAQNIINNKIKNATDLKKIALKAQYKDPIKKTGEKGLRNIVEDALESDLKKAGLTT